MIRPSGALTVYICREAVDMRKSIDGLSALVARPDATIVLAT